MRIKRLHHLLQLAPKPDRFIDVPLPLARKPALGRRHRRWKNLKQDVAVVGLPKRILQGFEALRDRAQRRVDRLEALGGIAQPFAGNPKLVEPGAIAPL